MATTNTPMKQPIGLNAVYVSASKLKNYHALQIYLHPCMQVDTIATNIIAIFKAINELPIALDLNEDDIFMIKIRVNYYCDEKYALSTSYLEPSLTYHILGRYFYQCTNGLTNSATKICDRVFPYSRIF